MATRYEERAWGRAGFGFVNKTANDLKAGTRLKVGSLLFFLKADVPGYNATPSDSNPDNVKPWEGRAHLLHHQDARTLEIFLDDPLGQNFTFGQAVVLDGEHVGYAIPHPGPDAGDPGGGVYDTPTELSDGHIVARSADKIVRVVAIAPVGTVTANPVVQPKAADIGTITSGTTAGALETLIADATTAAGGALLDMHAEANTASATIDLNTLLGATLPGTITSWADGASITFLNTGANPLTYVEPVTSTNISVSAGSAITIRRLGSDLRVA